MHLLVNDGLCKRGFAVADYRMVHLRGTRGGGPNMCRGTLSIPWAYVGGRWDPCMTTDEAGRLLPTVHPAWDTPVRGMGWRALADDAPAREVRPPWAPATSAREEETLLITGHCTVIQRKNQAIAADRG